MRGQGVQVEVLEHFSAVAPVPGSHVVRGEPQHEPGERVCRAAEEPAVDAPVPRSAAGNVARADPDVMAVEESEEGRKNERIVTEIGIHSANALKTLFKRIAEPGDVGRAESLLSRTPDHVHAVRGGGQIGGAVREPSSTITMLRAFQTSRMAEINR